MINAKKKPHFLEIFLPNLSSERLRVPSKFIEHLGDIHSGSVSLTGPSGNSWNVDMIEYNGHFFFHDGWPTFVKDHSLQCGDSLVFRYDGNSDFTVQIFDQSSCEKEEAIFAKCSRGSSDCNGHLGKKRGRKKESFCLNVVAEKKLKGSMVPLHLDFPAGKSLKKLDLCTNGNLSSDRTDEFIEEFKKPVVLALTALNSPWTPIFVKSHSKIIASKVKKSTKVKKALKKKQKKGTPVNTSISKFIESRAAHYFTSDFPYFVRVMNYSNISGNGTMKIPMKFSSAHLPNCRIKVTLRNLNGDCWMINSVPTAKKHSTMHTFCGGWLGFVRGNGIKIEDVCIFELVGEFELLVRILRLGLEGLENQTGNSSIDVYGVETGRWPIETSESVSEHSKGGNCLEVPGQLNELSIYDYEENNANTKIVPALHQEASSFINTDQLLICNGEETKSVEASKGNQVQVQAIYTVHEQPTQDEATAAALSFTSPFPSFMKVMMTSNVGGSFTLAVPRKFSAAHLPSHKTEIILRNLKGDSWNVVSTRYGHQTKLCGGWMSFVRKNNVKVGDVCVFELVDVKVLQVRIFEASSKRQECLSNDVVVDDLTASVKSTQCIVVPEQLSAGV